MNKIKIAIVGVGAHALKTVIPAIVKCESLELVALVTSKKKCDLEKSIAHLPIFTDVESLIQQKLVDAAYVASPVEAHYLQCKELIESSIHVLCEKKMCSTYKQTQELFSIASAKGVILQEAFAYLYHPQFFKLQETLEICQKGKLQFVNASFTIPALNDSNVRYDSNLGGGALNDVAFYPLSMLLALFEGSFLKKSSLLISDVSKGIDTTGRFSCQVGSTLLSAQWAFDSTYSNEVEFIFDGYKLRVDRAFSKPAELNLPISNIDSYGHINNINYAASDQFVLMMNQFVKSVSIEKIPYTQPLSLKVAELIEEIRSNATCN